MTKNQKKINLLPSSELSLKMESIDFYSRNRIETNKFLLISIPFPSPKWCYILVYHSIAT